MVLRELNNFDSNDFEILIGNKFIMAKKTV